MTIVGQRLLPDNPLDRAGYEAIGGYRGLTAALADPVSARHALWETQLRGLGGAGFPFARKLGFACATEGPRVVVCNAAEDEPGSGKDRTLLARNPHLVIEGALIAASAIDAQNVVLYVSEVVEELTRSALAEMAGHAALHRVQVSIVRASADYVAGEASAAVSLINGGPGKPQVQPPYPTTSGVDGRPTLVSNCETLANLPRIVTGGAPDTRLVTVSGDVVAGGVFEIDPEVETFGSLIERAGGLTGSGVLKAIQPGGPSSAFLTADAVDVTLAPSAIAAAGSAAGCLAVGIYTSDRCMVEVVEAITEFFSTEQCGQCPSCRMKTQAYYRTVHQVSAGHGTWDMLDKLSVVEEFVSDMPRRCSLIDMPTPPVASARVLFADDFAGHIDRKLCPGHDAAVLPPLEMGSGS